PAINVPAGRLLPNAKSFVSVVLACASSRTALIVAVKTRHIPRHRGSTPVTPADRFEKLSVGLKLPARLMNPASDVPVTLLKNVVRSPLATAVVTLMVALSSNPGKLNVPVLISLVGTPNTRVRLPV